MNPLAEAVPSDARSVDLQTLVSGAQISPRQYAVAALCGVLAMVDGFDGQAMAFAAPAMAPALGIPVEQLGPVFSAGLAGSLVGTFAQGPIGDRWGRKPVLLGSFLLMALATLATITASTVSQLIALRLLAGLAIGAALPNIFAIVADYAPAGRRYLFVTAMFAGLPLGAVVGGAISAKLLVTSGWTSVFILGGILPLLLLPLAAAFVPESLSSLAARPSNRPRLLRTLRAFRIEPPPDIEIADANTPARAAPAQSVRHLFDGRYRTGTSLLWAVSFLSLLVSIFITSWLPTILSQAGVGLSSAVVASVVLNGGGIIGSLMISFLNDRLGPYRLQAAAYVVGAAALVAIGGLPLAGNAVTLLVFAVGVFFIGGQMCIAAAVSFFYPSSLRATGIGWAMGVGRIGAIIGPLIGGALLARKIPAGHLFHVAAGITLLAAGVWFALWRVTRINPKAG